MGRPAAVILTVLVALLPLSSIDVATTPSAEAAAAAGPTGNVAPAPVEDGDAGARPSGERTTGEAERTDGEAEQTAGRAERQRDEDGDTDEPYGRTPPELVPYRRTEDPYRRLYLSPFLYRGPGREKAEPAAPESVKVGLLAPLEGTARDRDGLGLKRGVELALRAANEAGGLDGRPFALVTRNDRLLWGSSSNALVELAYGDRVWAIIGSIDSTSTHVALRAALKAEIPIVNVGSADPTVTETGIPWIVRCTPDDRQTGYRLASLLFADRGLSRVVVLRSSDRYGRLGVGEFRDAARRLSRPLPMEIQFESGRVDFTSVLDRIEAAGAEAIVLWAGAADAGALVRRIRDRGMRQLVVGTDRLLSPVFLEAAGAAAEGVVVTAWMKPGRDDEEWRRFRRRFAATYGEMPDAFAAYGYDAADLVVRAIRRGGLNRARIRDELAAIRTYAGIAGTLRFDPTSNNVSPLYLARVEGGEFVPQR